MDLILVMNPQNSFFSKDGSVYMGEKAEILKIRLRDFLSDFSGTKIFFRERHAIEDSFFSTDKTHSIATSSDYMIEESLKSYADKFIDKIRYNAFFNTNLENYLKSNSIGTVYIAGVETHTSILFTAEELKNRGYDVVLVEPCSMARVDYMHVWAITLMRNVLGIRIGG